MIVLLLNSGQCYGAVVVKVVVVVVIMVVVLVVVVRVVVIAMVVVVVLELRAWLALAIQKNLLGSH